MTIVFFVISVWASSYKSDLTRREAAEAPVEEKAEEPVEAAPVEEKAAQERPVERGSAAEDGPMKKFQSICYDLRSFFYVGSFGLFVLGFWAFSVPAPGWGAYCILSSIVSLNIGVWGRKYNLQGAAEEPVEEAPVEEKAAQERPVERGSAAEDGLMEKTRADCYQCRGVLWCSFFVCLFLTYFMFKTRESGFGVFFLLLTITTYFISVWASNYKYVLTRREAEEEAAEKAEKARFDDILRESLDAFDVAVQLSECPVSDPRWKELATSYREKRRELWRQAGEWKDDRFAEYSRPARYRMNDQLELIEKIEACAPDDPALPGLRQQLRRLSLFS